MPEGTSDGQNEDSQVEFSDLNDEEEEKTSTPELRESITDSPRVERPKSRFWESIVLWSQTTTLHGVHYVTNVHSHTFRRVSWFIFITILLVLLIWYCQAQMNRYFEYKTMMLNIVYQNQKINFPAVSVCKLNFVQTNSVNSTEKILIDELLKPHTNKSTLVSKFGEQYMNETIVDYNTLLTNHTTNINDVFLSCKFDGAEFNCNQFHEHLSHSGQCFTYNSSTPVELFGDQYGMELLLWLGEDNTFPFDPSSPVFKVVLHVPGEEPDIDTAQLVGPGFTHYISVDTHQYKFMENPVQAYGGQYCINTELPEFKHYSKTTCYSTCGQQYTYKQCACVSPYKKDAASYQCSILKYVDCFKPALFPCYMAKYSTSLHSVYLPDRSYTTWNDQLSLNKSLDTLKHNMMAIKLFYKNKNLYFHEQTLEFKFEDLWASFGGYLGLATGASVLTFMEIVDIFVWNLYYHFQNIAQIMRRQPRPAA